MHETSLLCQQLIELIVSESAPPRFPFEFYKSAVSKQCKNAGNYLLLSDQVIFFRVKDTIIHDDIRNSEQKIHPIPSKS